MCRLTSCCGSAVVTLDTRCSDAAAVNHVSSSLVESLSADFTIDTANDRQRTSTTHVAALRKSLSLHKPMTSTLLTDNVTCRRHDGETGQLQASVRSGQPTDQSRDTVSPSVPTTSHRHAGHYQLIVTVGSIRVCRSSLLWDRNVCWPRRMLLRGESR